MPEINKIQIGQTVYTLADEVARSGSNTISLNNVRRYVSDFTTDVLTVTVGVLDQATHRLYAT